MLFTQAELARMMGMSPNTVRTRIRLGAIPAPTHPLGDDGRRLYYTENEAKKLIRQWQVTK